MKKILIALMILTASLSYSQGTIQITTDQAKEAIKAKQRVQKLESALQVQGLIISEYKIQVKDLKESGGHLSAELDLWKKNYDLLKTQFDAEIAKKPKDKTFTWILRCIAVAAVGYVAGSL